MSNWNYRVVRKPGFANEPYYEIHEVYYNEDGTIKYWSSDPMTPFGETPEELELDVTRMLKAFIRPLLKLVDDLLKEVEN